MAKFGLSRQKLEFPDVAISHGYDTCFQERLVMGQADYQIYWVWLKHLVIRLHSEIGQIHLSIEAQCGSPVYLWVTTTPDDAFPDFSDTTEKKIKHFTHTGTPDHRALFQ